MTNFMRQTIDKKFLQPASKRSRKVVISVCQSTPGVGGGAYVPHLHPIILPTTCPFWGRGWWAGVIPHSLAPNPFFGGTLVSGARSFPGGVPQFYHRSCQVGGPQERTACLGLGHPLPHLGRGVPPPRTGTPTWDWGMRYASCGFPREDFLGRFSFGLNQWMHKVHFHRWHMKSC